MMGLKSSVSSAKSVPPARVPNQSSSVRRYLVLSLASMRAAKASRHSAAKVVQYVDFAASSARSTRRTRGDCSCSTMALRCAAFAFQKAISTSGVGLSPCRSGVSGSRRRMELIWRVHVTMALSSSAMRVWAESLGLKPGSGSSVCACVCPTAMETLEMKLCSRSSTCLATTSPQPPFTAGFESTGM